ncbi:MAG: DUF3150 domain-containing protein [Methylomonas sp.]|nr:DUF3150 domain-containing protein [Methylomonas sp.]
MSHKAEMILEQVDVVKLDINLWTSSKKLRPEDLVLADGSKLPPEDLAYLGTKKTVDPDKIKEFSRIKKEAERICLQSGTRFLGGFANPRAEIPRITQELDELSKTFYEARDQFLSTYDQDTEEWIARHAEFGDAIRRAIEPVSSVAAKLRFDYVVFRVTSPEPVSVVPGEVSPAAVDSLNRRANSMSEQLFHEIAQEASQLIDRSFVGKDTVTGRSLNAFRRMRDKLDSLGFLDHRCMPVVDKIDTVLSAIPKNGPYNGVAFNSLFSLGLLLSDPDKIKRHGSGLLQASLAPMADEIDEDDLVIDSSQSQAVQPAIESPVSSEVDESVSAVSEPQSQSDDDLEDFDAFMANYKPDQDVFDNAQSSPIDVQIDVVKEDVFESAKATGFIESVKEVVNAAAQSVPSVAPVESAKDDLVTDDADETESEEAAVAADFWF